MRNSALIRRNIDILSEKGFFVESPQNYEWVCVHGLDLPGTPGSWTDKQGNVVFETSVLIDIPYDFPISPPGVGFSHPSRAIHLPLIYYNRYKMSDFYTCVHDPWCWFCFQSIDWDPMQDNLLTLLALVEASISERLRKAGLWQH
jgi:hypothetical protein